MRPLATSILAALAFSLGPLVAAGAGLYIAVGVSATHLLPTWGPMSDSLPNGDVDPFTWIAVLFEIVGAIVLGIVGWSTYRVQRPRVSVAVR